MSDWPDLLARSYEVIREPVRLLDEVLFDRPTPCTEWTIADLFGHMVGAIDRFAAASGAAPPDAQVGDASPIGRFEAAVARSLARWGSSSDPAAMLSLPYGDFPAELVVAMNQLDSLIHGWDLAAALGVPLTIPDDLAHAAMQTARVRVPLGRGRVFGGEVATSSTRPGEALLAFTGRDPAAWPGAIWVGGSLVTIKPTGGEPSAASAVEIWERRGSGPARHVHASHDETWYVIEGRFRFLVGDREFDAGPGDFIAGPRGVPHTFRAQTDRSRMLDIHSPGGFEHFFVRAGRPATALVPPEPMANEPVGPLLETMQAFGATVVGPPLGQ